MTYFTTITEIIHMIARSLVVMINHTHATHSEQSHFLDRSYQIMVAIAQNIL